MGAWAAVAAIAMAPTGWMVSDALERDNDFCNACHLASGEPLHLAVREGFDAAPARTLAGAHGAALLPGSDEGPRAFRCIDCHGGVGPVGKLRVKVLAAKDAFWWAVGDFEEPEGMRWPLWDEDCSQCHPDFDVKAGPDRDPAFHDLAVHNVELGVDCVECHRSHERGANVDAWFLKPATVRQQCSRCHAEFEELTKFEQLEERKG